MPGPLPTARRYAPMTIALSALPSHRAHGDIVPGVDTSDSGCPSPLTPHEQ
jgi:hypothetical protein